MGQVKTNLVREALYDRIRDQVEDFAEKRPAAPGGNLQSVTVVAGSPTDGFRPAHGDVDTVGQQHAGKRKPGIWNK